MKEHLPENAHPVLRDVAELCGEAVALNLVRHYAGQRLYVPDAPSDKHHLTRTLGAAQVAKLVAAFGGDRISVPRTLASGAAGRKSLVLRLSAQGVSVRQIAAQAECTEVRVYQILAAARRLSCRARKPTGAP